jgi:hypothetical protein
MKRILAIAVLVLASVPAMAQHPGYRGGRGYWHHGYDGRWSWVAPVVVGGVIGYEISRANQPVVVQQPPVIIPPAPVVYGAPAPNCSVWTETQQPDGSIVRTRTCTQ